MPAIVLSVAIAATLGCASMGQAEPSYSATVEAKDSTGGTVRIQTERDRTPRIVQVPFKEDWAWQDGCFRAKVQRTVSDPNDQGELQVTVTYDRYHQETRRTALLMGVIDLRLCFDFPPWEND